MQYFTCCGPGSRGAICPNATARTRARTIGSTAGLGEESGSVFSMRWRQIAKPHCVQRRAVLSSNLRLKRLVDFVCHDPVTSCIKVYVAFCEQILIPIKIWSVLKLEKVWERINKVRTSTLTPRFPYRNLQTMPIVVVKLCWPRINHDRKFNP